MSAHFVRSTIMPSSISDFRIAMRTIVGLVTTIASCQIALAAPLTIQDKPLFVTNPVPPMAMIDFTKDHQLYYKAYNDYSDLDGDGSYETTYKHSFDYYGYFDSYKCYTYSTANSRFEPTATTTDKYCSGQWSGNFMNWVSMSRIDVMRKVLYGGTRSTDSATLTVLERSYLPTDAHSWAKYYNGTDIAQLTPFTVATTPATGTSTTSMTIPAASQSFTVTTALAGQLGDQIHLVSAASTTNFMYGVVTATAAGTLTIQVAGNVPAAKGGAGTYNNWNLTNLSTSGISFCNTTYDAPAALSHTSVAPPLIRAARGNYSLWSANERFQCYWIGEKSDSTYQNGNRVYYSGLAASARNPDSASRGLYVSGLTGKADYVARVLACDSAQLGSESCVQYPNGNWKPVGLLQRYGEGASPKILFGLMTGSYAKNISGGVLRKNIGKLEDEINDGTDGTFKSAVGIVRTIDRLRLYGYQYGPDADGNKGTYIGYDNCNFQLTSITEGNCATWGNPISELVLESLRYLAGKSANSDYTYTSSGSKDAALGLPAPVAWTDPLNGQNWCSPLNTLVVSSTASTFDGDKLGKFSTDFEAATVANPLPLNTYTDIVGSGEGIIGAKAAIGYSEHEDPPNPTVIEDDGLCTGKTIGSFAKARGLCPEVPSLRGTYQIAGLAHYAKTNRIRVSAGGVTPEADEMSAFKVTTYGIQLATNTPRITIPVGTSTVTIQPAYRLVKGAGQFGTGTLVDFKIVQQTATSGLFYVNWEDSNQGGDYDQDLIGTISYTVSGSQISVTTAVIAESTNQPQGFGFIISGTDKDGPHFYSGIENFSYTDPTNIVVTAADAATEINASGGCNSCSDPANPRTATFNVGTSDTLQLKDPLYYAAKWGGFKDADTNSTDPGYNKPDKQSEWDSKLADGTPGSDGLPDTYFYVNNPGNLEKALNTAFVAIVSSSAASAVATNSSSLQTGTQIYQARFNPLNWTGELVSYTIDPVTLDLTENWNSAQCMKNALVPASGACTSASTATADRFIFTYKPSTQAGVLFKTLADLDTTQQTALQLSGTESASTTQSRLDYLRGDNANAGLAAGQFRERPVTVLGDIVTSSPFYVGEPRGQYEIDFLYYPAYANPANTNNYFTFRNANLTRTPMLYVGGNDGMLHGFDATTGIEKMAFIPNALMPNLKELANQSYQHKFFVDGAPIVADVEFTTGWKTILAGGYNQGGKGIYALDVTDPTKFAAATVGELPLWEFTSANDSDFGLSYGTPHVAKMNNGKWAVIMANGYNSTSENAALFVFFIEEGKTGWTASSTYIKIPTCSVYASACGSNGLSSPAAMDYDGNGSVDFVYAGDLKGNLWKFDVRDSDPSNWAVATLQTQGSATSAIQPLFVACTDDSLPCPTAKRQAITAKPAVTTATDLTSVMVFVGTGKYLEANDSSTTQTQSVYGVMEKITVASDGTLTFETATRSKLRQSVLTDVNTCTVGSNTYVCTVRTATAADPDYVNGDKGWYQNLPDSGERIVAPMHLLNGYVFYNTFIPSTSPCEFGGTGYLQAVLGETGGQADKPVFDTDGNGVIDSQDMPAGGIKVGAVLGGSTIIKPSGSGIGVAISNPTKPAGNDPEPARDPVSGQVFVGNRISWRQLIND